MRAVRRRPAFALAAVVFAATPAADARMVRVDSETEPAAVEDNLWREMVEPHAVEVNLITAQVLQLVLAPLDAGFQTDDQLGAEQRTRVLQAALVSLKRARKLAPENLLVLQQLGRVADELGNTRQALEALQACLDLTGPDKAGPGVTGHLGSIYLRLGDLDAAVRYLRLAQGPAVTAESGQVLVDLSTALALRGQMGDAIEVLAGAMPGAFDYSAEQWGIAFALAVQYDRDDQRGAAFAILDKLQGVLQDQSFGNQMQNWFASLRFTPPEDEHYYNGLLYETLGAYAEARTEWALYAASGGAFRGRALQHVAALDEERRHPRAEAGSAVGLPRPPANGGGMTPYPYPPSGRPHHRRRP